MSGEFAGGVAGAPEQIGADLADDGPAGILGRHRTDHRAAVVRAGGGQPHQAAQRNHLAVDGHAVAVGQRYVQRAARTFVAVRAQAEEHEAGIARQQLGDPLRIGLGPVADALHADLFLRHQALLDQPAADRLVRVAILVAVADAQLPAVFQLDAPGTLDLQELQVHRVAQPGEHRRAGAVVADRRGVVVGFQHPAFQASAQALALEFRVDAFQRDHHQVVRYAVDRHRGFFALAQAAVVDRFVVAGDQALVAVAGGTQAIDLHPLLEERAHRRRIGGDRRGARTGLAPYRVLGQPRAGRAPGIEAGEQVGVAGGRQGVPGHAVVGGDFGGFGRGLFLAVVACGQQGGERERAEQQAAPGMERKLHAKDFLVVDRSPLAWAKRDGASNCGDDRSVSPRYTEAAMSSRSQRWAGSRCERSCQSMARS
ncbi:Uncharacterised protein [Acinetobacter baumannii]|nr:Uncharacterised protein [Acinetobacter baumannii]